MAKRWTAQVGSPLDDIDIEVYRDLSDGRWHWTVYFIRLSQTGSAATHEAAKAAASQTLTALGDRFKSDLTDSAYRAIHAQTYQWKESTDENEEDD